MVSGLVGLGGGIILVPALVYFFDMSQHKSQGTSLFIIIPTAFIGAYMYSLQGHMDLNIAVWVAIGGFAGGYFGSFFAGRLSERSLKLMYMALLMVVGVKMLF